MVKKTIIFVCALMYPLLDSTAQLTLSHPVEYYVSEKWPGNLVHRQKITREQPDQATLATIQFLHDHHNQNLAELQTTYARLKAERAAIRAELAANPPQPRDIHFRVSRLSREQAAAWHRHAVERKGGAR